MLDQLRQLAIFAKTVETGSFRGAAQALNLSPSVVSHHITNLEDTLGVALLYRSTRKLSLTQDGEKLFRSAREMVAAAESGLDGINAGASEATGRLKVTAPAVMAHSGLIERIVAFANAHPKVDLDVSFTDVRRDLIGEGIDVAIRMGWLKDSSLKSKKLASEDRLLLAAPSYVDGRDTPTHPSDLQHWNLILLSGVGRQVGFEHHSEQSLTLTFSPRIVVDDAVALYRMVRAGAGLGGAATVSCRRRSCGGESG